MDSKDPDAKPLPVAKMMVHHFLYFAAGAPACRPAAASATRFPGGRGEEHPSGRFDTVAPPDFRARYGVHNTTPQGHAPHVVADHDGDEPLPALQALLRPHAHLVHDRAAHADLPDRGRRLPPPAQRDGLRRPRRRPARLDVHGSLDLDRPVQRPHHRRRLPPPRRRDQPHARRARRAAAGCSTPRRTTAPPITRTTRSGRSCTSPARSPTARSAARRASRWPRARCSSASPCTTTRRCTWPRWASGCCCWRKDDAVTGCAADAERRREVTVPAKYDTLAPFVFSRTVPQLFKPSGR